MDMNDLLKLGATIFQQSKLSGDAGSNLDLGSLASALGGLTGGDKGFDLGSIVNAMNSGGLGGVLSSWLGDGANDGISLEQVGQMLGPDKISDFASQLGVSEEEALGGLTDALPQMMDKASSGGSILDSLGGIEGILGMAGKLFK